jgi:hypothetical protein
MEHSGLAVVALSAFAGLGQLNESALVLACLSGPRAVPVDRWAGLPAD